MLDCELLQVQGTGVEKSSAVNSSCAKARLGLASAPLYVGPTVEQAEYQRDFLKNDGVHWRSVPFSQGQDTTFKESQKAFMLRTVRTSVSGHDHSYKALDAFDTKTTGQHEHFAKG